MLTFPFLGTLRATLRHRPDISVIVRSSEVSEPIEDTLRSIGCSTFGMDRIEVVLVCDAGRQAGFDRLGAECLNGAPLRVIPMDPASSHSTRLNKALRQARGRYSFILDVCACIDRECLQRYFQALSAEPGATAALAPDACFSAVDRRVAGMRYDGRLDYHSLLYENPTFALNALFDTRRIRRAGGFNEAVPGTCMPAYELWLRLARTGHRLIWMDGDILSFSRVEQDAWHLTKDVAGLLRQLESVRKHHPMDMQKVIGDTRFKSHTEPDLITSILYFESANPTDTETSKPPSHAYSETDTVETQTYRWEKRLHFHLKPDRPYRSLRFDPIEGPFRIRIDKLSFRRQGRQIALQPTFISNGKPLGKGVWRFDTDDPSIILRFPGHQSVWIDECLIDFEWLDVHTTTNEEAKAVPNIPVLHQPTRIAEKGDTQLKSVSEPPTLECGIRLPLSFTLPSGRHLERLAVLCHAFHTGLMPEIRNCLDNIPPPFDIFLTTDAEAKLPDIRKAFEGWTSGRIEIKVFENRGRDVAPKLLAWPEVYRDCGLLLHIHTKKTDYNNYL